MVHLNMAHLLLFFRVHTMNRKSLIFLGTLFAGAITGASPVVFEGVGGNPAGLTPTRDAFRAAVGGGTVGAANGDFGGVRREINWDGVPDAKSAPSRFLQCNFTPRRRFQHAGDRLSRQRQCRRRHSAPFRLSERLANIQRTKALHRSEQYSHGH